MLEPAPLKQVAQERLVSLRDDEVEVVRARPRGGVLRTDAGELWGRRKSGFRKS